MERWKEILIKASAKLRGSTKLPVFNIEENDRKFMRAARRGWPAQAQEAIDADPSCVNRVRRDGDTALIWSLWLLEGAMASMLLDEGADPNLKGNNDETALSIAAYFQDPPLVRKLIIAGAEVNAQNADGVSPLINAVTSLGTENLRLLLAAGADISLVGELFEFRGTALDQAKKRRKTEYIELLEAAERGERPTAAEMGLPERSVLRVRKQRAERGVRGI